MSGLTKKLTNGTSNAIETDSAKELRIDKWPNESHSSIEPIVVSIFIREYLSQPNFSHGLAQFTVKLHLFNKMYSSFFWRYNEKSVLEGPTLCKNKGDPSVTLGW